MGTSQPIRNLETLKVFKNYYLNENPNPRNYALIITGLNTALRISDILHLTWGKVYDFSEDRWNKHITLSEQKTGKLNCILINDEIKKALGKYKTCVESGKDDWIFSGLEGSHLPLSRAQAFRIVKSAAKYAGLGDGISCHSMRKTFGYQAWKQGVSPALLMEIFNHSSYQVTRRYLCIDQDDRDTVFENIRL